MDGLVSLNQTWQGEQVQNVLGFSNVIEDADWLQAFADDIASEWDGNMRLNVSDNHSLDNITVSFINGGEILYSIDVPFTGGPISGADLGDVVASQNAMLVSLGYVGPRPNRGRIYYCGFTEGDMTNGTWLGAGVAGAQNFTEALQNGVGEPGSLAFLRIMGRPAANDGIYKSSPVSTINVRGRVATQRRRRLQ